MPQDRPTLLRENLCCARCNKLLGETVKTVGVTLFLSIQQRRIIVGSLPNYIICEDCGGRWQNPAWEAPADLMGLLPYFRQFVDAIPRAPLPERNYGAVAQARARA